ncbi:hypothetical protein ABK864_03565 [Serratia marcescens]|uniref:hypothetical protein n=1 Tax=Serratia TaxID=613 RepID=UPI00313E89BC
MTYDVVYSDGRVENLTLSIEEIVQMLQRPDVETVAGLRDERTIDEVARRLVEL